MKKFAITIISLFLFYGAGWTQSCLEEGFIFTQQAEIDDFQVNYPNCTEIIGDITISGEDINNLWGFSNIVSFNSDIKISNNPSLQTLVKYRNPSSLTMVMYFWLNR